MRLPVCIFPLSSIWPIHTCIYAQHSHAKAQVHVMIGTDRKWVCLFDVNHFAASNLWTDQQEQTPYYGQVIADASLPPGNAHTRKHVMRRGCSNFICQEIWVLRIQCIPIVLFRRGSKQYLCIGFIDKCLFYTQFGGYENDALHNWFSPNAVFL